MEKNKSIFKKHQFELYFLALYLLFAIKYLPTISELESYNCANWFIGYEYGLISRGLVGAIMNLAFTNSILPYQLYLIAFSFLTIMYFLATGYFAKILKKSEDNYKNSLVYLVFLYMISPAGFAYLFQTINFARYDMFLVMITVLCFWVILKSKQYYIVPLFSLIAIMIHQSFIFLFFPAIFMLMVYKYIKQGKKKAQLITIIITAITSCAIFVYLQFFAKLYHLDVNTVLSEVAAKTTMVLHPAPMELEYFTPIKYHIQIMSQYPLWNRLIGLVLIMIFMAPMAYVFINFWKNVLKKSSSKIVYLFMTVGCFLATIPAFILAIDWGRWCATIIMVQTLLIITLAALKDDNVINALSNLQQKIINKFPLYMFIFALTASIGYFVAADFIGLQLDILDIIASLS